MDISQFISLRIILKDSEAFQAIGEKSGTHGRVDEQLGRLPGEEPFLPGGGRGARQVPSGNEA